MAYVSTQKTAEIRAKLKEVFPEIKFLVNRGTNYNGALNVHIMRSPYKFLNVERYIARFNGNPPVPAEQLTNILNGEGYTLDINPYHLHSTDTLYENVGIIEKILDICNDGNWDRSDVRSDYFDVGWYINLTVGKGDKYYVLSKKKEVLA